MSDTTADEPPVIVEARDQKLYITLNRPRQLNAHNEPLRHALEAAIDRLDNDDDLLVGILKANGRAFSAGADLKEATPLPGGRTGFEHFIKVETARKPMIACLHGYAMGGGLELALCCDIRIACADALLGTPEPRTFGGIPAVAVYRLANVIPRGEAMKIMLSSQPISAQRAYEIGLVQDVAPDYDAMVAAADKLADQMRECNVAALQTIKKLASWTYMNDTYEAERFGKEINANRTRREGDRSQYLADRKGE
ncbi:MAG: enoyl-CoA hydratase/isomerase family protein [Acidimicrobiia bacterium]